MFNLSSPVLSGSLTYNDNDEIQLNSASNGEIYWNVQLMNNQLTEGKKF